MQCWLRSCCSRADASSATCRPQCEQGRRLGALDRWRCAFAGGGGLAGGFGVLGGNFGSGGRSEPDRCLSKRSRSSAAFSAEAGVERSRRSAAPRFLTEAGDGVPSDEEESSALGCLAGSCSLAGSGSLARSGPGESRLLGLVPLRGHGIPRIGDFLILILSLCRRACSSRRRWHLGRARRHARVNNIYDIKTKPRDKNKMCLRWCALYALYIYIYTTASVLIYIYVYMHMAHKPRALGRSRSSLARPQPWRAQPLLGRSRRKGARPQPWQTRPARPQPWRAQPLLGRSRRKGARPQPWLTKSLRGRSRRRDARPQPWRSQAAAVTAKLTARVG